MTTQRFTATTPIPELSLDFVHPGNMHEYGEHHYEKNPQTGAQIFVGIRWKPIFIESVEIIGSQVYLGVRDVFNYDETGATPDEIGDVAYYENLILYPRLQIVGTARKREMDIKTKGDKKIAEKIMSNQTINISKDYLNNIVAALKLYYPDFNCDQDLTTEEKQIDGRTFLVVQRKPEAQNESA
jgi:hypothetical protein